MKTSNYAMAMASIVLLMLLFHNEPALADGCSTPSFAPAVNYETGEGCWAVAVGDFNGDGKPDLVVANIYTDQVSVLLGNGDGTFQRAVSYKAGPDSQSVTVGDFNGDGKADLAVTSFIIGDFKISAVSMLLGNGDGTFQSAVNYGPTDMPVSAAVGDFNGDGKPDLAVANNNSGNVSVLFRNGDDTF